MPIGAGAVARGFLRRGRADSASTGCDVKRKVGTFEEFKDYTFASRPRRARSRPEGTEGMVRTRSRREAAEQEVQFASLEAGAKLLSAKTAPSCASSPNVIRNRSRNWRR